MVIPSLESVSSARHPSGTEVGGVTVAGGLMSGNLRTVLWILLGVAGTLLAVIVALVFYVRATN